MIHEPLHDSRAVGWTKGHHDRCIESLGGFEGQYIFQLLAISDVVISFMKVEFAKQDGALSIFNDGVDTGEWHNIFDHVLVDGMVVKEGSKCSVLLLIVEHWDAIWGAHFSDKTFCKLFCNIVGVEFLFCMGQRVWPAVNRCGVLGVSWMWWSYSQCGGICLAFSFKNMSM